MKCTKTIKKCIRDFNHGKRGIFALSFRKLLKISYEFHGRITEAYHLFPCPRYLIIIYFFNTSRSSTFQFLSEMIRNRWLRQDYHFWKPCADIFNDISEKIGNDQFQAAIGMKKDVILQAKFVDILYKEIIYSTNFAAQTWKFIQNNEFSKVGHCTISNNVCTNILVCKIHSVFAVPSCHFSIDTHLY